MSVPSDKLIFVSTKPSVFPMTVSFLTSLPFGRFPKMIRGRYNKEIH